MKIFGKKSLSSVLYWCSTLCLIGLSLLFVFLLGSLILNSYTIDTNNQFTIPFLFNDTFIKGDYSPIIFPAIISFVLFYGAFCFLLRLIFDAFSRDKELFTKNTLQHIKIFSLLNIIGPILGVIIAHFIKNGIDLEVFLQTGLHVLLGLFCLFVVAVFNRGIVLQDETNLTI